MPVVVDRSNKKVPVCDSQLDQKLDHFSNLIMLFFQPY